MASKLDSFLNFFKIDDDIEPDDYDEFGDGFYEPVKPKASRNRNVEVEETDEDEDDYAPRKPFRSSRPKVVPMHSSPKMMEVNIIKPKSFEDSQEICNTLLSQRPVVVNLEGFDPDEAQRIMDFITGCVFAINGKFHQISKYIFIFSPENVDISGDSLSFSGENLGSAPTINREF